MENLQAKNKKVLVFGLQINYSVIMINISLRILRRRTVLRPNRSEPWFTSVYLIHESLIPSSREIRILKQINQN